MRDINYGFPALEHRYQVLGGTDPVTLPDADLFDISAKLIDIYGPQYAPHPRQESLMRLNNISDQHFLSGKEEADAFTRRAYVQLHQSTLRKVDVIHNIAERELSGMLRTRLGWWQRNGSSVTGLVEAVTDTWVYKVLGFIGIVASIASWARPGSGS